MKKENVERPDLRTDPRFEGLAISDAQFERMDKTRKRLARALHRAIKSAPIKTPAALKPIFFRISLHAEKLGWISF